MGGLMAQEWNSARISVLNGGNIPFVFNTLDRLRKGIELNNASKFGITLNTNNVSGHDLTGFQLNFRSFNMQPAIQGEVYSIPLDRIRVKAENALGLETGLSQGYVSLNTDWMPLFSYENPLWTNLSWNTHQISISYECGKPVDMGGNGVLLGESPDYYVVEIEFEIIPTGPGF
jgi:hypothetical protein